MFRKRTKKEIPADCFLPMRQRVTAIVQLCIAFTLLAWYGSQPFMGKHFAIKSRLVVFEQVLDKLPEGNREAILSAYEGLKQQLEVSFWAKLKESVRVLAVEIPPFELAWLVLSIVIAVMLLKKAEGAWQAAWLLPLLVFCYAIDNQQHAKPAPLSPDMALFPSEQTIVSDYLREPLSSSIFEQEGQLRRGWHLYLIREWAKEAPSSQSDIFAQQLAKGEAAFQLARASKLAEDRQPIPLVSNHRQSLLVLFFYLAWNLFFACTFVPRPLSSVIASITTELSG